VNITDRSTMTELQITACVFGSIYAFHKSNRKHMPWYYSEGSNSVPFCGSFFFVYDLAFCRYKALKSPISYFRRRCESFDMSSAHAVARCSSPLTAKCDDFHCQTVRKIPIGPKLWHACNSKQLHRRVSVHLSSVYTDYSISTLRFYRFYTTFSFFMQ